MALSILNNISALTAQNQLSATQSNLQRTLTQLSSGLKINSGADDAAGLSIANGLTANIAALTQSQQNASNGIGLLQTADGALSQVTALLNRAVTLATEAANSTLNGSNMSQSVALNTEFQTILKTINTIGSTTNFNGSAVFGNSALSIAMSDGTTSGNMTVTPTVGTLSTQTIGLGQVATSAGTATLTLNSNPTAGDTVTIGGQTYKFVASGSATNAGDVAIAAGGAAATAANLIAAITGGAGSATTFGGITANANVTAATGGGAVVNLTAANVNVAGTAATLSTNNSTAMTFNKAALVANSDHDLLTNANAAASLTLLTQAISQVAAQRGTVGAAINQLQSASNIMNTQVQNLSSAQNSVMNADIGKTVAEMTQYNILQSTGMSALQQANQAQQSVLKLLQ